MDEVEVTEDDVRRSRHGYYASLSYVDEKIGEVLDAFEACGLADDSVVIFTSDHGDFLGEHGLFYKMSFREHASRVPLIVSAPGRFAPRRVREPVSLLDALPTLADLARPGLSSELAAPIDGRSLLPLLDGAPESEDGAALGEYLAESALGPMLMIRRGRRKFIHAASDPDQLFDLEDDPLELVNLAGEPAHADVVAAFRAEVAERWNLEQLERAVRESQQARLAVFRALQQGAPYAWDFQPSRAASTQYTRNTMDVALRDQQSRFPRAT
jgi:choline-sulfatase